jgi:phage shock protein C
MCPMLVTRFWRDKQRGEKMARLYRSRTNRVIAGIAGGLGEYFQVDPVIVRLLWVLLGFAGGNGVLLYIIAWILIPEEPIVVRREQNAASTVDEASDGKQANDESDPMESSPQADSENRRRLFGGLLLLAGVLLLAEKTAFWIDPAWLLPAGLIAAGLVILVRGWR